MWESHLSGSERGLAAIRKRKAALPTHPNRQTAITVHVYELIAYTAGGPAAREFCQHSEKRQASSEVP